jgi:signal transduction histidine kinase
MLETALTTRLEGMNNVDIRRIAKQTLKDSAYLFCTFPIALASFIVLVTGISLGAALTITWVGLPILASALYCAHGFAAFERLRLAADGCEIDPVPPKPTARKGFSKFLAAIGNTTMWREAGHGMLNLVVACITWPVLVAWWAMGAGGLTAWIWEPTTKRLGADSRGLAELLHLPVPNSVLYAFIGVAAIATMPWVLRGMTMLHIGLARAFLSPTRHELERRIATLTQARESLGEAEAASLSRLEKDIHDGPQQSLIRLGMDISAAQRRIDSGDTDAAKEVLAQARALNDATIAQLRALSRGMMPPVLAERGLTAALTSLAAASPIPTRIDAKLTNEPPKQVAAAAYFAASEALANAAKHSKASKIGIYLGEYEGNLQLAVSDDGIGGAQLLPGHGLAGLAERVGALDGTLGVDSMGGTTVRISIPM